MIEGGYRVNPDWSDAHRQSSNSPHPTSTDYLHDAFRAGPSPTYGVPYWVPRPPKKK